MTVWRSIATAALAGGLLAGLSASGADGGSPEVRGLAREVGSVPTWDVGTASRVATPLGAVSPPSTAVLRSAWNTGIDTSMLVDGTGVAHVAFYDDGTGSVMLASCALPCGEPSVRTLAPVPGVGTDIALVGDRLVVSYLDLDTRTVQLASCPVADCDRVQRQPVASADTVGATRMAVTPDGDLVIGLPALGGGLSVLRCAADDCRSADPVPAPGADHHVDLATGVDGGVWVTSRARSGHVVLSRCTGTVCAPLTTSAAVGVFPSVVVTEDGTVRFSYHAIDDHTLRLVACGADGACREVVIDDAGETGYFSAVTVRPSGLPLIAHRSESPRALLVTDCRVPDCSVVSRHTVDGRGDPGQHLSLGLTADGIPTIAHLDSASNALRLTTCSDATCAVPTGGEHDGLSVSVNTADDGMALVAWRHPNTLDLRLSRCLGGPCLDGVGADSSGDVGLHPSLVVTGGGERSILYQRVDDGALRLATCGDVCSDASIASVPTVGGPVARATARAHPDGAITVVVSTRDGEVHSGRCHAPGCDGLGWTTIAAGRPNGPIATAVTGVEGRTATAFTDDDGTALVVCAATCTTVRVDAEPAAGVDVTDVGRAIVVASRDATGQVTVHRCTASGCRPIAVLAGPYLDAAVAADGDRVTVVALTSTGSVAVYACGVTCAVVTELEAPRDAWDIDVHRQDGQDTIAVLGPDGPWVAMCDVAACTSEGGHADTGDNARMGHISNQ